MSNKQINNSPQSPYSMEAYMKKQYRKTVFVFMMMMSAALFLACPGSNSNGDNNTGNNTDPAVVSVAILDKDGNAFNTEQIDGAIGGTVQFKQAVQVVNGASKIVIWTVSGGNEKSSILGGLLSIAADETHGAILTVTVTSNADPAKSDSIKVKAVSASNVFSNDYFSENFDPSLCSFYDKFDGTGTSVNANGLDRARWGYQNGNGVEGWGNWEAQNYQGDTNAKVVNGILSLIAEKRQVGSQQYASAKLVSATGDGNTPSQPFSQTYGRFEAKMRMSKAEEGMWPAWWMMPVSDSAYGGWPRSGEIDIMEMKGRFPKASSSTIHWRPDWPNITDWQNQYKGGEVHFPASSDITQWHVYGVRWQPDAIIFLFDGMEHTRISRSQWNLGFYQGKGWPNTAPFDKDFFLILNLAVGGMFDEYRMPRDTELPISLDIDWVRVYTLGNDPWTIQPLGSGYTSSDTSNY